MSDIDNLLDGTLDDLSDTPTFTPFSPGAHIAKLTLKLKDIQGGKAVSCNLEGMETQELSDEATGEALKPGDSCSALFNLSNDYGQGDFKMVCEALAPTLGTTVPREIIEAAVDIEVMVLTSTRQDTNDKEKFYLQIKSVAVI